MSILEKALEIALLVHKGQVDKAGKPYILHPLRVMARMATEEEMAVALLHDTIEDGPTGIRSLLFANMPNEVEKAIATLTIEPGETYSDYIDCIANNKLATKVKLADLEDNINILRLGSITEKDLARVSKYFYAWQKLTAASLTK